MKKITYIIAILVLLVSSCSKNDEVISGVDENETFGNVSFSLQTAATKAKLAAKNDNPTPTAITISVINENNEDVIDNETYTLTNFNNSYLTENIQLPTGNYTLTKFNVINSDNEIILTAPILGDELSQFTNTPLPINFIVTKDNITNVIPPVLWTDVDDVPTVLSEVYEGKMLLNSSFTTNQESIELLDSYQNLTTLGDFTFTIGRKAGYTYLVKIISSSTDEKNIETFKFDDPDIYLEKIISVGDYLIATDRSQIYVLDFSNQSYNKYNYSNLSTYHISSSNNTLYTMSGNQFFKSEDIGVSFQLVNSELPFDSSYSDNAMISYNNAIYILGGDNSSFTQSLYRSNDGGITFENIAGGPFNFETTLFEAGGGNILITEYSKVNLFNTANNTIEVKEAFPKVSSLSIGVSSFFSEQLVMRINDKIIK